MTSVARILAVWLTPTVVLAVPAALAARGPDGLWLGYDASPNAIKTALTPPS